MTTDKKAATKAERDTVLPPVTDGELGTVEALAVLERKTTPPKPYTEGALIEDMANCSKYVDDPKFRKTLKAVSGLGTAATRAAIIEDLKKYGMLSAEKGKLYSTDKGRALIKYLPQELCDIARTALWEAELGLIGQGAGSQATFEAGILEEVNRYVDLLKAGPSMTSLPASATNTTTAEARKGSRNVQASNRNGAGQASPPLLPTDKQLDYASKLAARLGVKLPASVRTDLAACREFLDKYSTSAPPSEKALSFAGAIAERKSISIPDAAQRNAKELSAWIDANK